MEHVTGQLQEAEKQLQKARSDVAERDQLLDDIRHSLRCSQDELRNRNREVEELDQALKERQWELHHRAAQVGPQSLNHQLKADRPHPRDYSTHRPTPWTDNDSSLLFAALGKAEPLISTTTRQKFYLYL